MALAVAAAAKGLAIGSTTGNLGIGDNAGETWSDVAGRLPPIVQAAFA